MFNQKGSAHLFLALIAAIGFLSFLLISNAVDFSQKSIFSKLSPKPTSQAITNTSAWSEPTVFTFYYGWYTGTPDYQQWSGSGHNPAEGDLATTHFPFLGAYDREDVLDEHMRWLKTAKVDVIVLSYWGKDHTLSTDAFVTKLLDKASEYGLKVAFMMEPASVETQKINIEHIIDNLTNNGTHPGLYKVVRQTKYGQSLNSRPLFLFYNWGLHYGSNRPDLTVEQVKALYRDLFDSLRNTKYDGIFLTDNARTALILDPSNPIPDHSARFDLNNFHSDGNFAYDSDGAIWSGETFAKHDDYISLIHVAPGFDNTRIGESKIISRNNGAHYDDSWKEVASQKPEWVVILTFNEWGEGSQIEPAIPFTAGTYIYQNYEGHFELTGNNAQPAYINRTAYWVNQYKSQTPASPTPGGGGAGITPTPTQTPTSTPTPRAGSVINILAAGIPAKGEYPKMALFIDYQYKATFIVDKGNPFLRIFQTFTYQADAPVTAKQVQIGFINDYHDRKEDRNLLVDFVNIDGKRYEIESPTTYSTGTKIGKNCKIGYPKSEWLHCNGYFALESSN